MPCGQSADTDDAAGDIDQRIRPVAIYGRVPVIKLVANQRTSQA